MVNEYYKSTLNNRNRWLYDKMLASFQNQLTTVETTGFSVRDIQDVYLAVYSDHPELFYLPHLSKVIQYENGLKATSNLTVNKIFTKNEIIQYRLSINQVVKDLANTCLGCKTEYEIEKNVCDYFIKNVRYEINNTYNQNAAITLVKNKGQCSGISKAVKLVFDNLNVECFIVYGTSRNEEGKFTPHSWNMIKIDGDYYHLDVTYLVGANSAKIKPYIYPYFNSSSARFSQDHKWEVDKYPKCNKDDKLALQYPLPSEAEKQARQTISSIDEFKRCIGRAYDERKNSFTFKAAFSEKNMEKLTDVFMDEAICVAKKRNVSLSVRLSALGDVVTMTFDWN